ncbi:glycine/sarcosine/betaine reductase selenoprotein B family protein [Thermodesulfobacteriota bacterium]
MARLEEMNPVESKHLAKFECPTFENQPWVEGPPLNERRVAIISTAGLHTRGDRPFALEPGDFYRVIPGDIQAKDLVMSHVSTNFDHTGWQQDWNIVFPLDRLKEFVDEGIVGSLASFHYSFMGAHDPMLMEKEVRHIAGLLKKDGVNAVLLLPV